MHRTLRMAIMAFGSLVMFGETSNAAEPRAGWADVFVNLGMYQLTFTEPVVNKEKTAYRQTAKYEWTGGREEVLEVTVARDPAFKEKHAAETLKKDKTPPQEVEVGNKKAWLWTFPLEAGKPDQITGRLIVVLDADKALIIERKGMGLALPELAKKFDLARIEKALAEPPQAKRAEKHQVVTAVVKVNGKTKQFDGEKYHLVALQYDPIVDLLISGSTSVYWLINDKGRAETVRQVELADRLPGKLESPRPGSVLLMMWLKLPAEGELEILVGAVIVGPEKGEQLRKKLLDYNYVPFTIDVSKIPDLKADTAEELSRELKKLAK